MEFAVTILGARGSVPTSGKAYARYGGATTCVLVRAGQTHIVLDAGTGLLTLPEEALNCERLPLLLSHTHADHIMGLPLCPYVMRRDARLDIYGATRGGMDVETQVRRLLCPPLWPVGPEALPAEIHFFELPPTLRFGDAEVDTMEGVHPGGVTLYRVSAGGKRLVFATDCTLTDTLETKLADFLRDCDLLLLDGQYRDDEWAERAGFGHSSWGYAARFALACGVRRLRIIHHDPWRTDEALDCAAAELRAIDPAYDFGREGEVIRL